MSIKTLYICDYCGNPILDGEYAYTVDGSIHRFNENNAYAMGEVRFGEAVCNPLTHFHEYCLIKALDSSKTEEKLVNETPDQIVVGQKNRNIGD